MVKRMSRALAAFIVLFGPTAWCSVADGGSPAPAMYAASSLNGPSLPSFRPFTSRHTTSSPLVTT